MHTNTFLVALFKRFFHFYYMPANFVCTVTLICKGLFRLICKPFSAMYSLFSQWEFKRCTKLFIFYDKTSAFLCICADFCGTVFTYIFDTLNSIRKSFSACCKHLGGPSVVKHINYVMILPCLPSLFPPFGTLCEPPNS
jgi:hypothetical protein